MPHRSLLPIRSLSASDRVPRSRRDGRRARGGRGGAPLLAALAVVLVAASCTGDDGGDGGDGDGGARGAGSDTTTDAETDDGRTLDFAGPDDDALLNADDLQDLRFEVEVTGGDANVDDLVVLLDGDDVTDEAEREASLLRYEPRDLDDGEYTVAIAELDEAVEEAREDETGGDDADGDDGNGTDETGGDDGNGGDANGDDANGDDASESDASESDPDGAPAAAGSEVLHEWSFTVDTTPPDIELTSPDGAVVADEPVLVAGTTEPGATVSVDGHEVETDEDGAFELELDTPPEGEFEVVAVDAAGNRSAQEQGRLVTVPSRVALDEIRGVHVTGHAWSHPDFRARLLQMVDDGRINTIQLDLKDEGGRVVYDTEVDLAIESGAAENVFSLEDAVEELHGRGIHIVGRIVAFRDPVLGAHAQEQGSMDWLIQTPEGEPYTGQYPCCFTSFANDEVIEYHLDIAEEAAAAGVDDILWDYIRRPDGSPDSMVVPGLSEEADGATLEQAVVDFAARADERLRPYGVGHGASLYGIAADRPTEIAQDVPAMAEHLDYVAPMIYPSHWGPGEYGVDDPNRQPYDIITATLDVWKDATDGTRARIVPWLEDTNYRAWDRPHQVREQIRAAADQGIDEWLMWDPVVNYTVDAYDPRED